MLRLALRPYLASLLLLCLTRTLLPEAWVVALHRHEHTLDEPAFVAHKLRPGQALLTTAHTHCHAEQFYDVPFEAARPVRMPRPVCRLRYQRLPVSAVLACAGALRRGVTLRGPPVG